MKATAKRRGWDEELTPEQEFDLEPYEAESDDLEGELVQFTVAATEHHSDIQVCTVGGQEADPATVRVI